MDRQLISLKFTLLRHTTAGLRPVGWVIGALLVLGTWSALALATDAARSSVTALAFVGWTLGAILGPILMSGSGTLRPEYFSLLPLERRSLGRGLLVSAFVSIASGFVLLAFAASAVYAAALAPASLLVVFVGAPLSWVFAITASRLVYGLTGAAMRSKLGVEIAGIQFGLMFAVMFTGWMIVQVSMQSFPALLERPPGGTAHDGTFRVTHLVASSGDRRGRRGRAGHGGPASDCSRCAGCRDGAGCDPGAGSAHGCLVGP